MKITKTPKRLAEATLHVKNLLGRIESASDDELAPILNAVPEWCWPRGDLHYWSGTLNRFDDILEKTCKDYDLYKLQINEFTPSRKRLLISILRFSRLLLENCTNRKLYASYEHLNALLFTQDLDVFETTLRLILRPAQQYSSQGGSRGGHDFRISAQRLQVLAVNWSPREHGLDMAELSKPDIVIPAELLRVRFQFYKRVIVGADAAAGSSSVTAETATTVQTTEDAARTPSRPPRQSGRTGPVSAGSGLQAVASPATPHTPAAPATPAAAAVQEGMTTVDLGDLSNETRRPMDVLADAVEQYAIPTECHFELFHKIRLAMSLRDAAARRQLLVCRLLAIACYVHTTSESTAATQLFLYEPDTVQRTATLVDPDHHVGTDVQSGAFYALDALGRYRGKLNDVLNSVNASVNHGILLHVLRNLVDKLGVPDAPDVDDRLIDALFGFMGFVTSTAVGSNMVVSAGLLPLLIQLVESTLPSKYLLQRTITRAVGLIDSVIYAYQPSFGLFCASRGLDVFVARIESEVTSDIEVGAESKPLEDPSMGESNSDNLYGRLSFGRAQLLRSLCKSISHMMSQTGTAEGLRNLIDSSLLSSIQRIMQNRRIFGGQILAIAINIMATFVHNEPTSLGIVQEKKLPETFLELIEADIEANFEVISSIPNALGALCLNDAGIELLKQRPIVPKLFNLFTSERHTRVLADRDNASMFGSSIDELVRHQPSLKETVLKSTIGVLREIERAGKAYELTENDVQSLYRLGKISSSTGAGDAMDLEGGEDAATSSANASEVVPATVALADAVYEEPDLVNKDDAPRDNRIVAFMDVTARFLDGLFQTTSHCKDFVKSDGLAYLLRFYRLPCLPYNFVGSIANDSLVALLRFIAEVSPTAVLHAILKEVKMSLRDSVHLLVPEKVISPNVPCASRLVELLAPSTDEEQASANARFRQLVRLNAHTHLLSDIAPTFTYAGAKMPTTFLQTINETATAAVTDLASLKDLGFLHRLAAWENILLKASVPAPLKPAKAQAEEAKANTAATSTATSTQASTHPSGSGTPAAAVTSAVAKPEDDAKAANATALRYLASQLPSSISAFFGETTRLFALRRSSDANHRRQTNTTAAELARIVRGNLDWREADSVANSFAYATAMVAQATSLLYDDRPGAATTAQTPVLMHFVKGDGVEKLVTLLDLFMAETTNHFDDHGQPRKNVSMYDSLRLGHVCAGLKVTLGLMQLLVSHKPLLDASATSLLMSKEGSDRSANDFFAPNEVIIHARSLILAGLKRLWTQTWLPQMPFAVNRSVIQIMLQIMHAEGEAYIIKKDSSNAAGAGGAVGSGVLGGHPRDSASLSAALSGLTGALGVVLGDAPRGPRSRLAVQPDEDRIRQLMEMGFSRAASRAALMHCGNNLTLSTEYLLTHPEIVANPGPADGAEPPSDSQSEIAAGEAEQADPAPAAAPVDGSSAAAQPPVSAVEQAGEASGTAAAADQVSLPATAAAGDGDTQMVDAGASADSSVKPADPLESKNAPFLQAAKKEKEALDAERQQLQSTLTQRALELADHHEGLVFDVKAAISLVCSDQEKMSAVLDQLLEQVRGAAQEAFGTREKAVAMRMHLLAIILNDAAFVKKIGETAVRSIMQPVSALIDNYASRPNPSADAAWLPSHLLIAASVLCLDEEPAEITVLTEEDPDKLAALPRAPVIKPAKFEVEARSLFNHSVHCLERADKLSREVLLSLYRLLVILTRRPAVAADFVKRGGVAALFKPFSTNSPKDLAGCQAYTVIILRQVIEDVATLRASMEQEMRAWFDATRAKTVDTGALTRHLGHVMLRNPDVFMELAVDHLDMFDYLPTKVQGFLRLKKEEKEEQIKTGAEPKNIDVPGVAENEGDEAMDVLPSPTKPVAAPLGDLDVAMEDASKTEQKPITLAPSAELEHTMHFLLSELVKATREQAARPKTLAQQNAEPNKTSEDQPTGASSNAQQPQHVAQEDGEASAAAAAANKADDASDSLYFYMCFLMQCLTELLSSYVAAKTCFLNFSKKRLMSSTLSASTVALKSRPSHAVLTFFLTELVPIGFLSAYEHSEMRKLMAQSNWSMSVLVALAADVTVHADIKEVAPELIGVRKSVLDCIAKVIKDASASPEPVEVRYGRLYALADLCYRLLTARPNQSPNGVGPRQTEDLTLHMAKSMLEKNFVGVLTTALADVDLNLPMVKSLLDRILKPLEHLTKAAIKMGKAERKAAADRSGVREASPASSEESDEIDDEDGFESGEYDSMDEDDDERGEEHGGRDETPDFYRNSALGIHASENFATQEDSEDEGSGDEDMEMEYDSQEDGSDLSDDEDDDEDEDMEHIVEVVDEDDMDDDDDDDENSEEADDLEDASDTDDQGEWVFEEDDDDGSQGEDMPLDFVLANDNHAHNDFVSQAQDFLDGEEHDHEHIVTMHEEDEEGMDDMDEEDDEDGEDMEPDDLEQLELAEAVGIHGAPPEDRFGANWGWTHMPAFPRVGAGGAGVGAGGAAPPNFALPGMPNFFLGPQHEALLGMPRRTTRLLDFDGPVMAQRSRPGGAGDDVASHPLLVDQQGAGSSAVGQRSSSSHQRRHAPGQAHGHQHWTQSVEELMGGMGGGAMQILAGLLNQPPPGINGDQTVQVSVTTDASGAPHFIVGGAPMERGPGLGPNTGGRGAQPSSAWVRSRPDPVAAVQEFSPMPTATRWAEAARVLHGAAVAERSSRLRPHVINALLPSLRRHQAEERKKKEEKAESERKLREQLAENRRQLDEKAKEITKLKEEVEDAQRKQEQAANAVSEAEAAEERAREAEAIALSQQSVSDAEDVEMSDAAPVADASADGAQAQDDTSTDSQQPNLELDSLQRSLGELERPASSTQASTNAGGASTGEVAADTSTEAAAPAVAAPAARVMVSIRGQEIDITDTGIDPTFLEALPDDMREEVLNQHFRERRATTASTGAADSNIAPEFLDALPPEIRAEVIQQEAAESRRQRGAGEPAEGGERAAEPRGSAPGSSAVSGLIAELDPDMRTLLIGQGLDNVPPEMIADLRRHRRRTDAMRAFADRGSAGLNGLPAPLDVHKPLTRDAIQVLDKAGVATLVRLLFFPQMNSRSTGLHKVLSNLQENGKTRTELLNLLLIILTEGTSDTNAVDKSYATMTARANKSNLSATPIRPAPRRHNSTPAGVALQATNTPNTAIASIAPISRTGDEAPSLIASRSIETLLHLTMHNEQSAFHFLREDARAPKKSKGKERAGDSRLLAPAPVNALLLLLAKQAILSNSQLVDSLIALLSVVTKPLTTIASNQKAGGEEKAKVPGFASTSTGPSSEPQASSDTQALGSTASAAAEGSSAVVAPSTDPAATPDGALTIMPHIPPERMAAVVRPLSTAISSKGFQHTLAVASNLSAIPGGREVISDALRREAEDAGRALVKDLDALLASLPPPSNTTDEEEEDANIKDAEPSSTSRIQSPALMTLASPASPQAVMLRSLRALEWIMSRPRPAAAS